MRSDLQIAQSAKLRPVVEIAEQLGLGPDDIDLYGSPYIGKVRLDVIEKFKDRPNAKYIDISAITPTPLGEGKSTTLIGLGRAMTPRQAPSSRSGNPRRGRPLASRAERRRLCTGRPDGTFNLNLTGDIHAVTAPNNCSPRSSTTSCFAAIRSTSTRTASRGNALSIPTTVRFARSSWASAAGWKAVFPAKPALTSRSLRR